MRVWSLTVIEKDENLVGPDLYLTLKSASAALIDHMRAMITAELNEQQGFLPENVSRTLELLAMGEVLLQPQSAVEHIDEMDEKYREFASSLDIRFWIKEHDHPWVFEADS